MNKREERERNLFVLATEYKMRFPAVRRLQALARRLHRLAVQDCNVGLSPRQQQLQDSAAAEIQRIAEAAGVYMETQDDPRGWPIMISHQPIEESMGARLARICPF